MTASRFIDILGPAALAVFTLGGGAAVIAAIRRRMDARERCIACDDLLIEGQDVYHDAGGGIIHAACCGPERESYTGPDGEPLGDGDRIPTPWRWTREPGRNPGRQP